MSLDGTELKLIKKVRTIIGLSLKCVFKRSRLHMENVTILWYSVN